MPHGRIGDIDWPLEREVRRVLAPRHRFDPDDRNAVAMWDTTLETLMFGRMIDAKFTPELKAPSVRMPPYHSRSSRAPAGSSRVSQVCRLRPGITRRP